MSLSEDAPVSRSHFRLHLDSLKRCTKLRHKYEVIQVSQSSEAGGGTKPACEDLAVASQHCLLWQRPYSSRRNTIRQDRPGSGPGKENMNPEDRTELGHKKVTPCERPSVRSSISSSLKMAYESRSSPAMALEPQVEPQDLSANQKRTLAGDKIKRCRRPPVTSLIQFPNQQSLQSSKGTGQIQVRSWPQQSKDDIISRNRFEASQKESGHTES